LFFKYRKLKNKEHNQRLFIVNAFSIDVYTLHMVINYFDFISKYIYIYIYIDLEMKEYYVPYTLTPQYNRECTELYFIFPSVSLNEIKFENYYISNNRTPTTNYKSIHFVIGCKELTEKEIQSFTLKDPNNEILNLYNRNKDLTNTQYHVRVVLNNRIDPIFNFYRMNFNKCHYYR
jgi:hypothetical protein